jgi:hypothetical protein
MINQAGNDDLTGYLNLFQLMPSSLCPLFNPVHILVTLSKLCEYISSQVHYLPVPLRVLNFSLGSVLIAWRVGSEFRLGFALERVVRSVFCEGCMSSYSSRFLLLPLSLRTIDKVTSTVDVEGTPLASEAVLVKRKLRGCQGRIPWGIP